MRTVDYEYRAGIWLRLGEVTVNIREPNERVLSCEVLDPALIGDLISSRWRAQSGIGGRLTEERQPFVGSVYDKDTRITGATSYRNLVRSSARLLIELLPAGRRSRRRLDQTDSNGTTPLMLAGLLP